MITKWIVTARLIVITLHCLNIINNQILRQKKHRGTGLVHIVQNIIIINLSTWNITAGVHKKPHHSNHLISNMWYAISRDPPTMMVVELVCDHPNMGKLPGLIPNKDCLICNILGEPRKQYRIIYIYIYIYIHTYNSFINVKTKTIKYLLWWLSYGRFSMDFLDL